MRRFQESCLGLEAGVALDEVAVDDGEQRRVHGGSRGRRVHVVGAPQVRVEDVRRRAQPLGQETLFSHETQSSSVLFISRHTPSMAGHAQARDRAPCMRIRCSDTLPRTQHTGRRSHTHSKEVQESNPQVGKRKKVQARPARTVIAINKTIIWNNPMTQIHHTC